MNAQAWQKYFPPRFNTPPEGMRLRMMSRAAFSPRLNASQMSPTESKMGRIFDNGVIPGTHPPVLFDTLLLSPYRRSI